jgi:hypothetical protein
MVNFTARIHEVQETHLLWGLAVEILEIDDGLPAAR